MQKRFCAKSARIFRLLCSKTHLEQNQLRELALVGDKKETKRLVNALFDAKFIKLQVRLLPLL